MKTLAATSLMIVVLMLSASSAKADMVTLKAIGEVNDLIGFSSSSLPFAVGDIFEATLTYDSATPDSMSGDPDVGDYLGAIVDFDFTIGSYSGGYDDGSSAILVMNNMGFLATDSVTLTATLDAPDVDGLSAATIQIAGWSQTGLVADDSLPSGEELVSFGTGSFGISYTDGSGEIVAAVAGNDSLTVVPEPSAWALLGLIAPIALGRRAIRRIRKQA